MIRPVFAALALAVFVLCTKAGAFADAVTVDPPHTSATFSVKHLLLTTVSGTIGLTSAELDIGKDDVPTSVRAVFDLSTIDTHAADRDADLRSEHWFEVAKYPTMTFASTTITPGPNHTMTIAGNLTFHGVTAPVTLAATYDGSVTDQHGRTHLGYSATATIDRKTWNLGSNYPPALVGSDVKIAIELEAIEGQKS